MRPQKKIPHTFTSNPAIRRLLVSHDWKSRFARARLPAAIKAAPFDELADRLRHHVRNAQAHATFERLGALYSLFPKETVAEIDFAVHNRAAYVVLKGSSPGPLCPRTQQLSALAWLLYKHEYRHAPAQGREYPPLGAYMPLVAGLALTDAAAVPQQTALLKDVLDFGRSAAEATGARAFSQFAETPLVQLLRWGKVREATHVFSTLQRAWSDRACTSVELVALLGAFAGAHAREWEKLRAGQRVSAARASGELLSELQTANPGAVAPALPALLRLVALSGDRHLDAAVASCSVNSGFPSHVGVEIVRLAQQGAWGDLAQLWEREGTLEVERALDSNGWGSLLRAWAETGDSERVWAAVASLSDEARVGIWRSTAFQQALAVAAGPSFHELVYRTRILPLTHFEAKSELEKRLLFALLQGYVGLGDSESKRRAGELLKQQRQATRPQVLFAEALAQAEFAEAVSA